VYKNFCAFYFRKGNRLQFYIALASLIISFALFTGLITSNFEESAKKQIEPYTQFVAAIFLAIVGNAIFNFFSVEIPNFRKQRIFRDTLDEYINDIVYDTVEIIIFPNYEGKDSKDTIKGNITYLNGNPQQKEKAINEYNNHIEKILDMINRIYILNIISNDALDCLESYKDYLQEFSDSIKNTQLKEVNFNMLYGATQDLVYFFNQYGIIEHFHMLYKTKPDKPKRRIKKEVPSAK